MKKNEEKTNVMRLLDAKKIEYKSYNYVDSGVISGIDVASVLGEDPARVFKTLVTEGASKKNYVFLLPVRDELDLKSAARAVGEKSIAMIKSKDLLPLTGYIHGGCSPIGMKKKFPTWIDESALQFERITVSSGTRGAQLLLSREALVRFVEAKVADLTEKSENNT